MEHELVNVKSEISDVLAEYGKSVEDISMMCIELSDKAIGIEYMMFDDMDAIPDALEYDNMHVDEGILRMYGTILLKNGDWLERAEYGGVEGWNYRTPVTAEYMDNLIRMVKGS